MPRVSVIVPVYNVERYLPQCLDSLMAQTLEDIEFVCVNDGSTDSSLELLRRAEAQDARFRVIDKPNAGYGHTINLGIAEARGSYVGIVESDDFVEPDMFECLLKRAEADDLDVVRANYWLYWSTPEERDELVDLCREELCRCAFDPRELSAPFFFSPALWSMLVRRDLIVSNGLRLLETPGASFQDTSFSFKIWACARRAALVHGAVLHYRQDNESSSINNRDKAYFVCREYAEVERFVLEDVCDPRLMPIAQKRKYDAYVWNLARIDPSLRPEFASRASAELGAALERGWLDTGLFSPSERRALKVLLRSPETFVARVNDGLPPSRPAALSRALRRLRGRRKFR
ncbi:glycosyltransferase [Olsenella uli]|uniref:glycosyltransferase n=1 Tax=Olsenella uli TaxID=133926 RepID=UPI001955FA85|nr:glycosyltransferase [Olsenella uli]MBM6676699.1 glycosyltransferase [Olsenella uli]